MFTIERNPQISDAHYAELVNKLLCSVQQDIFLINSCITAKKWTELRLVDNANILLFTYKLDYGYPVIMVFEINMREKLLRMLRNKTDVVYFTAITSQGHITFADAVMYIDDIIAHIERLIL